MSVAVLTLAVSACGRPEPPDLRGEMTEAVRRLGVRPVYPLNETHRLGAVHLVDASVAGPKGRLPSWQDTSLLLTEELVGPFEQARRKRVPIEARFPQSPPGLAGAVRPGTTGQAFYRQVSPKAEDGTAPADALSLAAMPGFTLASVDQASAGGFVPGLLASFFGAVGLRQTSFLRMEAEGVEMAELPYDDLRSLVRMGCRGSENDSHFGGQGQGAKGLVKAAYDLLDQQRSEREQAGERSWFRAGDSAGVDPYLALLRRVFYLRGVRFVVEDSRVSSAFLQAALQNRLPNGASPVSLPQVTVNTNVAPAPAQGQAGPAPGSSQAAATANAAAISALQGQIEQLRSSLATGSSTQLAASFARATATGIELVQLFDRPLAFGYQAVFVDARHDRQQPATRDNLGGFTPLCGSI